MTDITWLPDGRKAFEKIVAAIPDNMREEFRPKLIAMLAGKAAGEPVSASLINHWVQEDLPEPQKTVFLSVLGGAEKELKSAEESWEVTDRVASVGDLQAVRQKGRGLLVPSRFRITVGGATCSLAKKSMTVFEDLKYELRKNKIDADVVMVGSGGMSYAEPVVDIVRAGQDRVTYGNVTVARVKDIVAALASGKTVDDLVVMRRSSLKSDLAGEDLQYAETGAEQGTEFYQKQRRLLTRSCGTIAPGRIEEYIALGGYSALAKALTSMSPKQVIAEVKKSKLRGRGGAGFPTAIKWQACAANKGKTKYVVANGSEGDPEIGMHKSFLESDPHALVEGMAIAGYAIGASEGYVYLSNEYQLGVARVATAIAQAEKMGLLGDNILGSGFSFRLKVKRGGGAYICGEETALLNALEGAFGEPRTRPPLPVEKGLFGKPTVVNNVETLANIPIIVLQGGDWFSRIGTKASAGTKVVSLSGNVACPCWVEVPMGSAIRSIVDTFGKGTDTGKAVKAFQTGGPSGGFLPGRSMDLALDYDALAKAGTLLGSGGLLVMDEGSDMIDMARFLTEFFADESCGKCTPCREGLKQLGALVGNMAKGRATKADVDRIRGMGEAMADTCFCALGKTAAAPIMSVLKHFPEEVAVKMMRPIN